MGFIVLRVIGLVLVVLFAAACQEKAAQVFIEEAHMYEMPPGQTTGAVYLKLVNPTAKNVTLIHVDTVVAGTTEVHHTLYENGMMQMREVKHLVVPANSELVFKPGGHHLMLFDIEEAPVLSSKFPLTMEFNNGAAIVLEVEVRPRS